MRLVPRIAARASARRVWLPSIVLALTLAPAFACQTMPRPGEPCKPGERGHMRCQGHEAALACQGGSWQTIPCHGPDGCSGTGNNAKCDDGVAVVGEACSQNAMRQRGDDHACSQDGRTSLVCLEGRWEEARPCRGDKGCNHEDAVLRCDQSRAEVGDPCNDSQSSFGACSVDGQSMLRCDTSRNRPGARSYGRANGTFVVGRACSPKTGCRVGHVGTIPDMPAVLCAIPDARPGAPCPPKSDDAMVCSEDGLSVLRCDATRLLLTVEQTCLDGTHCQPVEPGSNLLRCRR